MTANVLRRKVLRLASTFLAMAVLIGSNLGITNNVKVRADGHNPGVVTFVTSLYSDCLGRTPDPAGLDDWCTKLENGSVTGKECAYGFFSSDEFKGIALDLTQDEMISVFYKVFLDRPADAAGLSYWRSQIAVFSTIGETATLFTGFADSEEFAQKCASYGITAGEHIPLRVYNPNVVADDFYTERNITIADLERYSNEQLSVLIDEYLVWLEENNVDPLSERRTDPAVLDAEYLSQGCEIWYIDIGGGVMQKAYVLFEDTTGHNAQVNSWRAQNGLPAYTTITDVNDPRMEFTRRRAVEAAYEFSHNPPSGRALEDTAPAGYVFRGENICSGMACQGSFEVFRSSPGHNAAMLSPVNTTISTASCVVVFTNREGTVIESTRTASVQEFWY